MTTSYANKQLTAVAGCLVAALGCSGVAEPGTENERVDTVRDAILCNGESRVQIPNFTYPRASLGAIQSADGTCAGTMIGHFKVLTSQHCMGDLPPNGVHFLPHANIPAFANYGSATSVRYVVGRDPVDTGEYSDWAIVTFGADLATFNNNGQIPFQTMGRVIPTGTATISGYGYPGQTPNGGIDWTGHATEDLNKTMTVGPSGSNPVLYSDLDVEHGNSGGPWWNLINGNGAVYGTVADSSANPEGGSCAGTQGNRASNGLYFAFAPDNAGGIAAANTGNGRLVTYATDMDWTLVASRSQQTTTVGSAFSAWGANDSGFTTGGRRLTAVNLQDNRIELFVITPSGGVKTRWQTAVDGGWSSWVDDSTPVTVKDIAATGGNGNATHLFVLGTDNSVRYTYKTGDANSAWAAWTNLGSVAGATALSAVRFPSVHEVFVASNTTSVTAWGNGASFTSLVDFGAPSGGLSAIGAGVLRDGRVSVMGYGPNGIKHRTRALDGSSWTAWNSTGLPTSLPVPIPNPTAFVSLTMGRLNGGYAKVLAVGSDGEIFTLDEQTTPDTFGDSTGWRRFYQ